MDKKLCLYKMPPFADVVNVVAITDTPPTNSTSGDVYLNTSYSPYRLYRNSGTTWVQVNPVNGKHYCTVENGVLKSVYYNNGYQEEDLKFPQNGRNAEIYDFTYSATRMGNAPVISATLMYERCLDEDWNDRVCTIFNGVKYYIDKTPTSSKNNSDSRYKHDLSFVSEFILLENVYFINVVDEDADFDNVCRDWSDFNFFGDVQNFVERLNMSMKYSHLHTNGIGFNIVIDNDLNMQDFLTNLEEPEKLVTINKMFLKSALDEIYNLWELPYYYDGYTIHIGFSNEQLAANQGVAMPEIEYGFKNELLSITKNNNTDRAINRCTGIGGDNNIPYFYPNLNPNGIELQYMRNEMLMINMAKIANPYKTNSLEPSTHFNPYDGSYFTYKNVPVAYNFSTDRNAFHSITNSAQNTDSFNRLFLTRNDRNIKITYNVSQPSYGMLGTDILSNPIEYSPLKPPSTSVCEIRCHVWVKLPVQGINRVDIKNTIDDYMLRKIMDPSSWLFTIPVAQPFELNDYGVGPFVSIRLKGSAGTITDDAFVSLGSNAEDSYGWVYGEDLINYNQNGNTYNEYVWERRDNWYFNASIPFPIGYWVLPSSDHIDTYPYVYDKYSDRFPIVKEFEDDNEYNCIRFDINLYVQKNQYSIIMPYIANFLNSHMKTAFKTYFNEPNWSKDDTNVSCALYNYGIRLNNNAVPQLGDVIYFTSTGLLPNMSNLMPFRYSTIGDVWYNALNNHYPKGDGFYSFESEYTVSHAKEHIEDFPDIYPTIKGCLNSDGESIDRIIDIAFDDDDNEDVDQSGNLLHPYFYVKLPRTSSTTEGFGFNLFDCAIDNDSMALSFTEGHCGGCKFNIEARRGSDGYMTNPIGVYEEDTVVNGILRQAGTPKRLSNGNVDTNQYQESQQDTENNEVWIALLKDNSTYNNEVMPKKGTFEPSTSDRFVLENICLPLAYIIDAEIRLEKAILDYMEDNNPEVFGFNVNFSRIFYKNNFQLMDRWVNESSLVPIKYNGHVKKFFAENYTYKMSSKEPLPEVTIDFNKKSRLRRSPHLIYLMNGAGPSATAGANQNATRSSRTTQGILFLNQNGQYELNEGLSISNDLFINGESLSETIGKIERNIELIGGDSGAETVWSKAGERIELENLFNDGAFKYDFNKIDGQLHTSSECVFGDKSLVISSLKSGTLLFLEQSLMLEKDKDYTVQFWIRKDLRSSFSNNSSFIVYSQEKDNPSTLDVFEEFVFESLNKENEQKWYVNSFSFKTTSENNEYKFAFKFYNTKSASFLLDGFMVFKGRYSMKTNKGVSIPTNISPSTFIPSKNDVDIAVKKGGGGGSSSMTIVTWHREK